MVCGNCPCRAQQGPGSPVHVVEPQALSGWELCLLAAQSRAHRGKATEEGSMVRLSGWLVVLCHLLVPLTGDVEGSPPAAFRRGRQPSLCVPCAATPLCRLPRSGIKGGWVLAGRVWHA